MTKEYIAAVKLFELWVLLEGSHSGVNRDKTKSYEDDYNEARKEFQELTGEEAPYFMSVTWLASFNKGQEAKNGG